LTTKQLPAAHYYIVYNNN